MTKPNTAKTVPQFITMSDKGKVRLYMKLLPPEHVHAKKETKGIEIDLVRAKFVWTITQ